MTPIAPPSGAEMMTITIDSIVARWTDPSRRPLFKGELIHIDGDTVCRCAQGDILHLAGWADERLASVDQSEADAAVAALLGISRAHSILLRNVNDSADGCPQDVLVAPERVLGPHAHLVLAFWHHLDAMTADDWGRVTAAMAAGTAAWTTRDIAWDAAEAAARDSARDSARDAGAAVWAAAMAAGAAAWASNEIQGHEHLAARERPLVFLPMFGLTINDLSATQEAS